MSDFDMYILPLFCNQNENYYCWSSMIMSSYFNVFAQKKMIRIYADIVQNPTFLGRFQTFGGQCITTRIPEMLGCFIKFA